MRVFFVAQYGPQAASSRTRVFDYLPLLRRDGLVCDVVVTIPDGLQRLNAGSWRLVYYLLSWVRTFWIGCLCVWALWRYDVVFIQKILLMTPFALLLRPFRRKIVFDFDDAIFTLEDPTATWLTRLRTRRRQSGLPLMLQAAHYAIVENAYTADYARQFCPSVSRITGPIDTDRYAPGDGHRSDQVVLGWIGSPTTTRYLALIQEPLRELARRYDHVSLCLIGADAFEVPDLPVRRLPWSLETEVGHLQSFDIGLMPLPDDPFTRGKGGYKLLQYMAMGLPVVASPVGINCEIVTHEVNGFLATTPDDWVRALEKLILDANLRKTMGYQGRRHMVGHYSLTKGSQTLWRILELAGNRR